MIIREMFVLMWIGIMVGIAMSLCKVFPDGVFPIAFASGMFARGGVEAIREIWKGEW